MADQKSPLSYCDKSCAMHIQLKSLTSISYIASLSLIVNVLIM